MIGMKASCLKLSPGICNLFSARHKLKATISIVIKSFLQDMLTLKVQAVLLNLLLACVFIKINA